MWLEVVGWVGGILFAGCGVPQAWQCYRQKHADGLSWTFLLMWLVGEVLTTIYVWPTQQWPLLFNYGVNLACLLVILRWRLWPARVKYVTIEGLHAAAVQQELNRLLGYDNTNRETLSRR